jgi:hypothetical protein
MAKTTDEKLSTGEQTGEQKPSNYKSLKMIGGAGGTGIPDTLKQRPTTGSFQTYRKMRSNPTIAMARLIATAPIRTADWSVDADEEVPEDRINFVQKLCEKLWHNLINDLMTALDFGFAPFEIVWKTDDSGEGAKFTIERIKPLLVDITQPRITLDTGRLAGIENLDVVLPLNQTLWYAYDTEAGNLYGRSRHENIRDTAWKEWVEIDGRASLYNRRVAGAVPMIEYPDGESTDKSGATRSHWDIARQLLSELEKCRGIAMPNVLAPYVDDFARSGGSAKDLKAWHIGFLESKDSHGEEFLSQMRHKESLMLRGWLVPERAASEAQTAGSRADSESHADLMGAMGDLVLEDCIRAINEQVIDRLLQFNYGKESVGTIRLKRAKIDNDVQSFIRELTKAVLGAPANVEMLLDTIDMQQLLDQAGLPQLKDGLDQAALAEKMKPQLPPPMVPGQAPEATKKPIENKEDLAASMVDSVMDTYRRAHKHLSAEMVFSRLSDLGYNFANIGGTSAGAVDLEPGEERSTPGDIRIDAKLTKINPQKIQALHDVDTDFKEELKGKIKDKGFDENHPILAVDTPVGYIVLDGHHRGHAAQDLKLKSIPAYTIQAPELQGLLNAKFGGAMPKKSRKLDKYIMIDGKPYADRKKNDHSNQSIAASKELGSRAEETGFTEADADPKELKIGIKVEMEHTDDPEVAKKIALDHLAEHPHYYSELLLPAEEKAGLSISDDDKGSTVKKKLEQTELQEETKDIAASTLPMGFDPSQARDEGGKWTITGGENREKNLINIESKMRELQNTHNTEHGAYVDYKTGEVENIVKGGMEKDEITPSVNVGIPPDKDVIHIHTHPEEAAPSGEDLAMLGWNRVRELRVVTPKNLYIVERVSVERNSNPRDIREHWDNVSNKVIQEHPEYDVEKTILEITKETNKKFNFKMTVKPKIELAMSFNPEQARDESGKWSSATGDIYGDKQLGAALPDVKHFSAKYKEKVGDQSFSKEDSSKLPNTARTADALRNDAVVVEPVLRGAIDGAAKEVGGSTYYGPEGKYAVKSLSSLRDKIEVRGKSPDSINDAVRGTVVVKDVKDIPQTLKSVTQSIEASGGRVLSADDKYAKPYESGYVGVHVDVMFKTPDGGQIKGEIQIHNDDMGTKEPAEQIYQQFRSLPEAHADRPKLIRQCRQLYAPFMAKVIKG